MSQMQRSSINLGGVTRRSESEIDQVGEGGWMARWLRAEEWG